jgi:hypothetical protein
MRFSKKVEKEIQSVGERLGSDLEALRHKRHNPFIKDDGRVDVDAYIQFLTQYNEFINHAPKPFRPIVDHDMRL